jgi:hypothetical protein
MQLASLPACTKKTPWFARLAADMRRRLPGYDGSRRLDKLKYKRPSIDVAFHQILRNYLCAILLLKVDFSLPHACIDRLLAIWKDFPLLPEPFRQQIPEHFQLVLSAMAALGIELPTIYCYDRCPQCAHIYRQVHGMPASGLHFHTPPSSLGAFSAMGVDLANTLELAY